MTNGNSTLTLIQDGMNQMIVQSGLTMTSENSNEVIYKNEDFSNGKVKMIASIPFKVEFAHRVAQITLGKTFMLFLTD